MNYRPATSHRGAFTLIELLVVIAIIGILAALVLGVGQAVVSSAKKQATQDTLAILDSALSAYMDETDGLPPAFVELPPIAPATEPDIWPMADARNMDYNTPANVPGVRQGAQMINSTGLFFEEAQKVPRVKAILDKLPSQYVVRRDVDTIPDPNPAASQRSLTTINDAWGNPIRFVHPAFDGVLQGANFGAPKDMTTMRLSATMVNSPNLKTTQVRRNNRTDIAVPVLAENLPDSDGGRCTGNRPYFYSSGEDAKVGWLVNATGIVIVADFNADNIYSQKPVLPTKP